MSGLTNEIGFISVMIFFFFCFFFQISAGEAGGLGQPDHAAVHGKFAAASSTSVTIASSHVDD